MTKWQVIYEIGGKQQKPITFNTERQAKQRAAMISFGGHKVDVLEIEDE
ncbi:hypothetical protein [Pediococcus pentosaceus]